MLTTASIPILLNVYFMQVSTSPVVRKAMPGVAERTATAIRGKKIPPKVVPNGDCNTSLCEGRMFAEAIGEGQ